MKRIICFWGGPGTGKSRTAAGVYNLLKKKKFNCEMNREWIKDWVWEKRQVLPGDQSYIFANQARFERVYMMQDMDFIISDNPMALGIFYGEKYDRYEQLHQGCRVLLKQHHAFCIDHGYKTDHIFLVREQDYNSKGRWQTEDEAKEFDVEIKKFLNDFNINYTTIQCHDNCEQDVVDYILKINQ